jgi:hypothetical protein
MVLGSLDKLSSLRRILDLDAVREVVVLSQSTTYGTRTALFDTESICALQLST